jgi:CheY-like chemotaxis protein/HPt (histidine-containing phosphotransfer) domain-containing protein
LAISKRLAELLGGKIWVDSDTGKGATFHFTMLARASASAAPPPWQRPQAQLAGRRLLVIEDNLTNQHIILQRCRNWAVSVDIAANGNEGLRLFEQSPPYDAIILDLQLPDTDGMTLAGEIRRRASRGLPPLLLLSSMRLRSDDTRPIEAGVAGYVHKPIRPAQLLEALCRALSIQLQREKKAPAAPALDPGLARRLPMRLLLADDNPINQKVGLSVLHKLGYRADVANNGLEVLRALEHKVYDLLFLDVQMPEMDGLETARQIRERWTPDRRPAIIAMTGNALMGDREKCLAAGMDDYISKPVRIAELQAALERWGPLKTVQSDTKILLRAKAASADDLLDQAVIGLLRSELSAQGADSVRERIDHFLGDAAQLLSQLSQDLRTPAKVAAHAKDLKAICAGVGARRITEFCQKLEELGQAGLSDGAPELLQELRAAFALTRTQLLPLAAPSSIESTH